MNNSYDDTRSVEESEYIFDRTDVRVVFISLYTIVFCGCFFGNFLVVLVIIFSRRLRSVTNFFLANLAIADLCVGIFCVYQNLSIYLITSWIFGDFLCRMYQFIHSMSYTASIFTLVALCGERYFAIIHPLTCKRILSLSRVKMAMSGVWLTSAMYSIPKFIWVQTITNYLGNNQTEIICISHRKKYNSELFDIVNFCLLYLVPLLTMTILYSRIALTLWQGTESLNDSQETKDSNSYSHSKYNHRTVHCSTRILQRLQSSPHQNNSVGMKNIRKGHMQQVLLQTYQANNVLRARRSVIKMLIVVVSVFAVCNLPFHARKMWQYWSPSYQGGSTFSSLFTPLTFLICYINSAVNPLLYAFFNRNFRRGVRVLLFCNSKYSDKNKRPSGFENSINKWSPSLRRCSTKSTKLQLSSISYATSSDFGS